MGTLYNQSVKTEPLIREAFEETERHVEELKDKGYTAEQAIKILEIAEQRRHMTYLYDKYNAVDEQLADFGDLAKSVSESISQIADKMTQEDEE